MAAKIGRLTGTAGQHLIHQRAQPPAISEMPFGEPDGLRELLATCSPQFMAPVVRLLHQERVVA